MGVVTSGVAWSKQVPIHLCHFPPGLYYEKCYKIGLQLLSKCSIVWQSQIHIIIVASRKCAIVPSKTSRQSYTPSLFLYAMQLCNNRFHENVTSEQVEEAEFAGVRTPGNLDRKQSNNRCSIAHASRSSPARCLGDLESGLVDGNSTSGKLSSPV